MQTLIALVVSVLILVAWTTPRRKYPPGPKRLPLIGNLLDIPRRHLQEAFAQFSKELNSDIVYLDAFGVPFIVLNSLEACKDLLEKRSSIYSSRFRQTMSYELIEGKRLAAMLPYGNEWREARRIMVKHINVADQEPILSSITHFVRKSLLPNLLKTPDDFQVHIRNGIGGSMISLVYGLPIKRVNDPWIAIAEQAMHCLTATLVPGQYLVDAFPILRHVPEWFPGAKFQREAKEWKQIFARMFEEPFKAVKKAMLDGTAQPSFLSRSLEEITIGSDQERLECLIENIGATFTAVVLLLFPHVREKAQAEIDSVIGRERLPELADKPSLPYLNAVLKETLRWRPIAPLGLPHMTSEDDLYRDYFIPKGAVVFGNSWAIFHDEKNFGNPSEFDPTRFLTPAGQLRVDKDLLDPEIVCTFGFGRRACPGANVALPSLWLSAASIVSCFDVMPEVDREGKPIAPVIEYTGNEVVAHPEPFRCRILPRDSKAAALIQAEYDETAEYI
ncbi:hypothetical protein NP233_g9289 [Leucocoprinus birnbaumii]|uniref:Cytochrome P450 n=1 Tax=Leucocoprinus birnbaumii TaxID=56174 RepID=A0AAD5VP85_9AGAR|nr:hypothetical protein NP233_g9289 [Leucocoprinus birnbaumii]